MTTLLYVDSVLIQFEMQPKAFYFSNEAILQHTTILVPRPSNGLLMFLFFTISICQRYFPRYMLELFIRIIADDDVF